jgi:glycosyltransferase involved in cell wall biosynthesis
MLAETVESVHMQTQVDWELLVVDDASTDDTWDFLSNLRMSNLRCFRQDVNSERCAGRNLGLAHAKSELVMFLDHDDLLRPGALAILKTALDNNSDAVAAVGARVDWLCNEHFARRDSHPHFLRKQDVFNDLLFGWSAVSGQNLYRTAIVRAAGGYNPEHITCEDRDLWLRVARMGPVMLCPETVMIYRVHPGQVRPDNLLQIREKVARSAIRILPKEKRRNGLLIRRCTLLIDQSEAALKEGRYIYGIWLALRSVAVRPGLFASPLIGLWVFRRLGRRVLHRLQEFRQQGEKHA